MAAPSEYGPDGPQREHGDNLGAEDDPVDIDGRYPSDLPVTDDEHPRRVHPHPEAAPRPLLLAALPAFAAATPAGHRGDRDDGDAVLVDGIAERAPGEYRILDAAEHLET